MKVLRRLIWFGARQREEYGNLQDLANNILTNGQMQPVGVCEPDEEDMQDPEYRGQPYVLIYGGRRYKAFELIEKVTGEDQEIEVKNFGKITRRKRLILELQENLARKDMTYQEQVKTVNEIWRLSKEEDPNITLGHIAQQMGVSLATISRDVQVAEAIEKRPELAAAGSKKAVLTAAKTADKLKARQMRSSEEKTTLDRAKLPDRIVTANMLTWYKTRPDNSAQVTMVDFPYGQNYFKSGQKRTKKSGDSLTSLSEYNDSPEYALDLMVNAVPEIIRTTRETGWVLAFMNAENRQFLKELFADCCTCHYDYRTTQHEYDTEIAFRTLLQQLGMDISDRPMPTRSRCAASLRGEDGKCKFPVPEMLEWIWIRPNSRNAPRYPLLHAKNLYEYIIVVNMGKAMLPRPCSNVLIYDAEYGNDRTHANQKPLALYKELVQRTTELGDVVVDPCYGSGNSLAAAGALSRGFYGCDLNPANRDTAIGRVAEHLVFAGESAETSSMVRYERERRREVEGVDDFSEADEIPPPPVRVTNEGDLLFYVEEIGRVKDGDNVSFVCNVRNGLHVFVTRRAETADEAYAQAEEIADELNILTEAGAIDPKTVDWKQYQDTKNSLGKGKMSSISTLGIGSLRD